MSSRIAMHMELLQLEQDLRARRRVHDWQLDQPAVSSVRARVGRALIACGHALVLSAGESAPRECLPAAG